MEEGTRHDKRLSCGSTKLEMTKLKNEVLKWYCTFKHSTLFNLPWRIWLSVDNPKSFNLSSHSSDEKWNRAADEYVQQWMEIGSHNRATCDVQPVLFCSKALFEFANKVVPTVDISSGYVCTNQHVFLIPPGKQRVHDIRMYEHSTKSVPPVTSSFPY